MGRCLTHGVTYDKKKAYELARASCREIAKKLKEAKEREQRLELEAREEEKARTAHLAYRKEVFEKYREADKKLVLARAHIRKDSVSVGTQVAPEDLKAPSEENADLETKLRGKLDRVEGRINVLLKTLPGDYEEARKEYLKKRPEVKDCYERYAEQAHAIRKRLREECGVDVSDTRKATEEEKREENNKKRRELRALRKQGLAPPPKRRNRSKPTTKGSVLNSDGETASDTDEEALPATGKNHPATEKNYPTSPVSEFNWGLLECPPTPGRE